MAIKPGVQPAVPPFVKSAAAPVAPNVPAAKKKFGKKKPAAGPQASAIMQQMMNGPPGSQ